MFREHHRGQDAFNAFMVAEKDEKPFDADERR